MTAAASIERCTGTPCTRIAARVVIRASAHDTRSDAALRGQYKKHMSLRASRTSVLYSYAARVPELLRHLPQFLRLFWRLLRDPRVSIWPKALLVGALLYLLSPLDLLPDALPVIGEVDDLVVLIVVCRLFLYLCPPEVVRDHVRRISIETR
jgi:uncharacterized membrane protein YkvA (DUF1232 family)